MRLAHLMDVRHRHRALGLALVLLGGCEQQQSDRTAITPGSTSSCAADSLRAMLHTALGDMHRRNPVPGISAAVFVPAQMKAPETAAVGSSAIGDGHPLGADDRFLAGSVGKMFFAALAMRRSVDGKLALDTPVSTWIHEPRIAALQWITPRMLLRHRSGIGEYDAPFINDLIQNPHRARAANDWLGVIQRSPPQQKDTAHFRYSDLNYVLLALVLDTLEPRGVYEAIDADFLRPLGLSGTVPSRSRRIERLVAGYDGSSSMFGQDAMLNGDSLIYNPQFEFGGGGFASTPRDLARWMSAFRKGELFPDSLWTRVVERPSDLPDSVHHWRGIGVHVDSGSLGRTYGHSGYMPGYVSWVRWYDTMKLSVAIQTNATDTIRLKDDGFAWTDSLALLTSRRCRQ